MNRFAKRVFLTFLLTILFIVPAFSESWYLCLGSYKQKTNADALVNSLADGGVNAVIDSFEKNSETYYRVLYAEGFSKRDDARNKIPEVESLPVISKLKISGIWICTGSEKLNAPKPEDVTSKVVIEKEEKTVAPKIEISVAKNEVGVVAEEKKETPVAATTTSATTAKTTTATKTTKTTKTTKSTKTPVKTTSTTTSKATTPAKTTTATKTTNKTAEKTENVPAIVEETPVAPVEEPVAPVEKTEAPVEKAETPAEKTSAPAEKIKIDIPAKNVAEVIVPAPAKTEVKEPAPEPVIESVQEPAAEPVEEEIPEPVIEPLEEPEELVKEPVEEIPVINPVEEPIPEINPEPIEETPIEEAPIIEEPVAEIPAEASVEEEKITIPSVMPSLSLAIDKAEKTVLKPNYAEDIICSEEFPYTVYVNSYRDEKAAIYDKVRLESYNVKPYIVKSYSPESGFLVSLYAGAHETKEEAEETQKTLKLYDVIGTKIVNYDSFAKSLRDYNNFVLSTNVTAYEFTDVKLPDTISDSVKRAVSLVPAHKDYFISELVIFDMENIKESGISDNYVEDLEDYLYQKDKVKAAVLATFEDRLYGHEVTVFVQAGEDFHIEGITTDTPRKLFIGDEVLEGYVSTKNGAHCVTALSKNHNEMIQIIGNNLTAPMFNIYITTNFDADALYTKSEFKKAVASLPASNGKNVRKLNYMLLETIDEEFAVEEGYDYCSSLLDGNTWTWSYFTQDNEEVTCITFNVDYDFIADSIYEKLVDKKIDNAIGENNRPSFVPFADSWFEISEEEVIELTTKIRSYITTEFAKNNTLTESDLVYFVEDTQLLSR